MQTPDSLDPETLAALLDGRLSEAKATDIRARLTTADQSTIDAYMDAVAIAEELADGAATDTESDIKNVIPLSTPHKRRTRWIGGASIGLLAAAAASFLMIRSFAENEDYTPQSYVAAISDGSLKPGTLLISATRGDAAVIADRTRAFRVGMLLTRIESDVRSGRDAAEDLSTISTVLRAIPGASALASTFDLFRNDPAALADNAQRRDAGTAALNAVERVFSRAAVYLESARIASAAGDEQFFRQILPRDLELAAKQRDLDESVRTELLSLIRDIEAEPRDLSVIQSKSESLLRALAN